MFWVLSMPMQKTIEKPTHLSSVINNFQGIFNASVFSELAMYTEIEMIMFMSG